MRVAAEISFTIDLIPNATALGVIVEQAVDQGFLVEGAGPSSAHNGYFTVVGRFGTQAFGRDALRRFNELVTFVERHGGDAKVS